MEQTANEILQVLAEQLNTSVPFIWTQVVVKARVQAVMGILLNGFLIAVIAKTMWSLDVDWSDDKSLKTCFMWLASAFFVVYVGVYVILLPDMVTNTVYPEYRALEMLSELLK